MLERGFYKNVSQNISLKLLKECGFCLSSIYSGCSNKTLYQYFVCKQIVTDVYLHLVLFRMHETDIAIEKNLDIVQYRGHWSAS